MSDVSKQFHDIFEAHHDPEIQELKRMRRKKEEKRKEKMIDLGLDVSQNL